MRDSLLGKVFAACDADEQAEFLNSAGREARRTWRDPLGIGGYDTQVSRIVDELDGDGRALIKRLAEFIISDEETPVIVKRVVYEDVVEPRPVAEEPAPAESF
jgi:hypothetical protein